MATSRITVRERIDPEITASLFANYRSSADAVLELIDNAVDSRIANLPIQIDLTVHPSSLIVETAGGEGMGLRDLERAYLRWGGSQKRGRQLLGQYGQGGKAAIGHLGRRFAVEASRPGDTVAWRFTDDDYRNRSRLKTYEVAEVAKRVAPELGYVRIRIDGIDKRIDLRRLAQRLAETYRPLLASGAATIRLNSAAVHPVQLVVAERREFSGNAAGGRLRGWIGIADAEQPTPGWVPGVRCYRLGRLIAEGEFFGHPTPAHVPSMARLIGEVEVPKVPLTMNKADFDRDSTQWVEVEHRMHRELAPLVRRLSREADAPPPASALRVAQQVRRLLSQALRLTEREDLFPGIAAARAGEAGEAGEAEGPEQRELLPSGPPEAEPREPRVPRPGDPRGRGRRGFGTIVIRSLDPSIRSTTVIEEGTRVIVINSRFPLFQERRGDVWYQLETAAREVCRAADGANVAEYERRVNEIVLMAAALRQRRRAGPHAQQLALPRGR